MTANVQGIVRSVVKDDKSHKRGRRGKKKSNLASWQRRKHAGEERVYVVKPIEKKGGRKGIEDFWERLIMRQNNTY